MTERFLATILIVLSLVLLVPLSSAELSKQHAAIVAGNEQTHIFVAQQKHGEAIRNAEATYELSFRTLGEDDPNTANLAIVYANLLTAIGLTDKAYTLYADAVRIFEKLDGPDSLRIVAPLIAMGEFEEGEKQLGFVQRALTIQRTQAPEDTLAYADAILLVGEYLAKHVSGREYAFTILKEALAIYTNEYGDKSPELIQPLMLLGNASARWGKTSLPKAYYRRALRIAKKTLSGEQYTQLLLNTGNYLLQYSRSSEARFFLNDALKASRKKFGKNDARTANAGISMAQFHMLSGDPKRAEPFLKHASEVFYGRPNYRNEELLALSLLVEVYERQGQRDQATPYCQAIGKISPWTDTQEYKPIFMGKPRYPFKYWRTGLEGYVTLEFTVDENGFVLNPRIVDSSGSESFHTASLEAVSRYRYAPAFVDGEPVATHGVRNKFTFEINGWRSSVRQTNLSRQR